MVKEYPKPSALNCKTEIRENYENFTEKMRKYTKRNCNYWGHVARFIHTATDQTTGKTIAYYGICKRCSKKVFMLTNGKIDKAACIHLIHITLEDLPKLIK